MSENNNINEWESKTSCEFYIGDQMFHRNAELFLKNFPKLKEDITNALTQNLDSIEHSKRKKNGREYKGLTADSINKALKKSLKNISDLKFEVKYKDGVLFDSPKIEGFDFALFDEEFNLVNFRNYCFGKKSIFEGVEEWTNELDKRADWKATADNLDLLDLTINAGVDLPAIKKVPTIIGEVQFANWALAYYDMFKVLHLDNLTDLDLLIYITGTGDLNNYLSDSIVNYKGMESIIIEHNSIIKVPIWLIGLDVK
ncbi:BglII/BstYI family type II restriction endonuclease [Sporosarcina sp. FA9]|uniref:BglII/BstYI family type II restriction endonuclease n=1 Tax=Sporosarcina sp. FA9 TaxID=3413030 RepID=UPI003F655DF4